MASVDITASGAAISPVFVSGAYLSAYDTQNHSLSAPYAVEQLSFNTTVLSSGITIQGTFSTDIIIATAGIYNIQFSTQVLNGSVQDHDFYLWLCKNGAAEAYSNSIVTVPSTHGGIDGHFIAAWNFVVQSVPGDSYQLCWSGNNTAISIETIASPAAPIPVSPSVILTVTQV
jgi:hypothetical protein